MSYIPIPIRQDIIDTNSAADINQLNDNIVDVNSRLGSKIGIIDFQYFIPTNALQFNGALKSRTTYADLWAKIQSFTTPIADAAWLAGDVGKFSEGDGSTTFRLPDFSGLHLRFVGDNSVMKMANNAAFSGGAVCSVANDIVQNITGVLSQQGNRAGMNSCSGVFTGAGSTSYAGAGSGGVVPVTMTFNSATSVSPYASRHTGIETAPARISLIPIIYFED